MGRKPRRFLKLDMPFDEALERFLQVDISEMPGGLNLSKRPIVKAKRRVPKAKKGR